MEYTLDDFDYNGRVYNKDHETMHMIQKVDRETGFVVVENPRRGVETFAPNQLIPIYEDNLKSILCAVGDLKAQGFDPVTVLNVASDLINAVYSLLHTTLDKRIPPGIMRRFRKIMNEIETTKK